MKQPAAPAASPASSAGSALARSRNFLRTQYWVWPLVAALILGFVAVFVRRQMEGAMKTQIAGNLQAILNANTEALRAWAATVKSRAEAAAEDPRVSDIIAGLVQRAAQQGTSQATLLAAPQLAPLRTLLQPELEHYGFNGYVVLTPDLLVVAAAREQLIGMRSPPGYEERLRPCLEGQSIVTPPFPSVTVIEDGRGKGRAGVPTMFAAAPVRSAEGKVIAVLALRIPPDKDFTRILATARAGQSGETYAFGRKGLMLSDSRFDEQLKRLGLIPDTPESQSVLTLDLRDPLADLTRGQHSPKRRAEQPMTRPVTEALTGRAGVDVTGYRDYRGVDVGKGL